MVKRTERSHRPTEITRLFYAIQLVFCAILSGCASPGQPRPPSLRLPQMVPDLSAQRIGNSVHLRWSTPSTTTDKLPVPTQISALICREEVSRLNTHRPCIPVQRLPLKPGPFEIVDALPSALVAGPIGLLAYRIEILNPAGRSAGRSPQTFAVSGTAPAAIEDLRATSVRRGVRLEWRPEPGTTTIELVRTNDPKSSSLAPDSKVSTPKHAVLPSSPPLYELHLSAKDPNQPDAGGTIDRSAQKGVTYIYTAQRVEESVLEGHTVSLRSVPSIPATITVLSTLPPEPPAGLEAAPGGKAETPSIDLSWQPGAEVDLAGYNVYRAEFHPGGPLAGSWHRLNSATVAVPAFRDTAVQGNQRYVYRVTSVDADGNESAPGNQVEETPGTG